MAAQSARLASTVLPPPKQPRPVRHPTHVAVRAFLALAMIPPFHATWIMWFAPVDAADAPRSALAGRDFTALWAAGRSAVEGTTSALAQPDLFTGWLRQLFGPGMPDQIWPYPPTTLLLAAPLAHLPLTSALVLYLAVSAALLWLALRAAKVDRGLAALVLVSPAALNCALAGQNGMLLTAGVLGGLAMVDRAPARSGVLLSITAIKPQFGLLLPIALLAGKRWRALCALLAVTAASIAASVACFGTSAWVEYLSTAHDAAWSHLSRPWDDQGAQRLFASAFMMVRAFGGSVWDAATIQTIVTIACAYLTWRTWQRPGDSVPDRIAFSLSLVLLAAPWVHSYDGVALACAVALLFREARTGEMPWLAAGWLLPGFVASPPPAGLQILATCGVATVAWRRLEREGLRCAVS